MPANPEADNVIVFGGQPPTTISPATRPKRAVKRRKSVDKPINVDTMNVENNRMRKELV